MIRSVVRSAGAIAGIALGLAAPAAARTTFELDDTRTEAWAMRWFAGLAAPTGFGVAAAGEPWTWEIGLEGGLIPSLSEDERRVGFNGTKVEELNRTSIFARPLVRLRLPADFALVAGWVPPVELDGVEPDLRSLALERPLWSGRRLRLGGRVFLLDGELSGDITCPEDEVAAGDDPVGNPFRCEEVSNDTLAIDALGAELGVAFAASPAIELFASALWYGLDGEFQVRATYANYVDRDKLLHSGDDLAFTAGVAWRPDDQWRIAGQLYYSPLDVVREPFGSREEENDALLNVRLAVSWRLN